jgi:predicted MPP superfamily phosphohydrolase
MEINEYKIYADIEKPLIFAFLSDLHDHPNGPLIKAIRGLNVDAVLVGGDFIHDDACYERGFDFLRLSSKLWRTFCSIGNHERKFAGDLKARIAESGATVLDDSYVMFEDIALGGLTTGYSVGEKQGHFEKTPAPNLKFLREFDKVDGFKLLLSHHPEYYPEYIKDTSVDLTLSGHAHGGQWRFLGRGVFSPGQGIFPKYTSGMYDGRLIVSRGLSEKCSIPRINNDTEIIVIKLFPIN